MRSGSRLTPVIPTVAEVNFSNVRTNVVRLLPNGDQWRFKGENVDFKATWIKYYQKYRDRLGVNAQAILQKNNEAWASFFTMLRLKKEGKLPPRNHVSPPGYWKEDGRRKRILVVRQDRYIVD
nr:hypothetical protein [Caldivirga sp. UBA161]